MKSLVLNEKTTLSGVALEAGVHTAESLDEQGVDRRAIAQLVMRGRACWQHGKATKAAASKKPAAKAVPTAAAVKKSTD